ncbi:hypothetical protein Lser_V15G37071 [Lactuca serriola]
MERSCDHSGHRRRIPPCLLFSDLGRRLPLSAITILDSASKMVAIDLKEKSHNTTFLPSHRHLSLLLLVDGYRLHYETSTVTISKVVQHSNIVFDYRKASSDRFPPLLLFRKGTTTNARMLISFHHGSFISIFGDNIE